jgi:hypothetical protein
MYCTAYLRQRIAVDKVVRQIGNAPIHYILSEECVSASSPLGKTELRWTALKELYITGEYTLIKWGSNTFVSLPTSQIPNNAQQFLIEQFRKHGLKIRQKTPNQSLQPTSGRSDV